MRNSHIALLVTFALLTPTWVATNNIQLFHYIHPPHSEQVAYVVSVFQYIVEKREWTRQFKVDEEKCPSFTTLMCPDGKVCRPPGEPPKQPPNVCDMPQYHASPLCGPTGDCYDDGTCPVKVCDVPFDLRKVLSDGDRICEPDDCNPNLVNPLPADCKPVTRCDLKIFEGHLKPEDCDDPDPCKKNPKLCVNECDLTGDYSPCGYISCYDWPFMPHCGTMPPPPPCTPESGKTESDNTCCVGLDCITPFDRCLWGQRIGKRVVDALTMTSQANNSTIGEDGNPVLDCITEYDQKEKQNLLFECFKDGVLAEGYELVNEKEIENIVNSQVVEGDVVVVNGNIEDQKLSVDITNTTNKTIDGAISSS